MKSIHQKIQILRGDITMQKVDAIVNAANSSLLGGGGVDGAIHRAGGPAIAEACKKIIARQGRCEAGEAVITTAGNLPAKYVIHTVGPVWHGGRNEEEQKLADCYRNSLRVAVENNCKTVAIPNISTGIYGFPKDNAASISLGTVLDFLSKNDAIDIIIYVCFDEDNYLLLKRYWKEGK